MGERNELITQTIETGLVPVLPFEVKFARTALARLEDEQKDLTVKLRAAMEQSSETWHDNPAADIISEDSMRVSSIANKKLDITNKSFEFGYESDDDGCVTLGSLVDVRYAKDPDINQMIITGTTREVPDEILESKDIIDADEVECVTLLSPLGKELFNKQAGDAITFEVNGRSVSLDIIAVRQILG